ncbi:MAG: bifunctional pyr operon transcriptional regulator/uracil phosphoribosyltransferase PyrR [Endomicrobiales bacterium]|nr:bifunctional pyr operon transcriptional regulator/uracil phosphoribosyltransferase PyrR [Endomicrobiales bacterium]
MEKIIAGKTEITKILKALAVQIAKANKDLSLLAIVGIQTRGKYLAKRIAELLNTTNKTKIPFGFIDTTLYRDDVATTSATRAIKETDLPFEVSDKKIILVDDVLFTGRTVRAALDGIMDFGRPKSIALAVLVDRGNRELPIAPDFIGMAIVTKPTDKVKLEVSELDGADRVILLKD